MFPVGCRWREVQLQDIKREAWAVGDYEFWDEQRSRWSSQRPAACSMAGHSLTSG